MFRAVFNQSSEADEAVRPCYLFATPKPCRDVVCQVKSLLALDSFVRSTTEGLKPIDANRLKAEAGRSSWVAVRAHGLEWFDSLPARAFETHALEPMKTSLIPKRNQIGVTIIKNMALHTPSPIIHEWALQHRSLHFFIYSAVFVSISKHFSILSGNVSAAEAPPRDYYDADYDYDSSEYFSASRENATISRAWLWRMHFLKVRFSSPPADVLPVVALCQCFLFFLLFRLHSSCLCCRVSLRLICFAFRTVIPPPP